MLHNLETSQASLKDELLCLVLSMAFWTGKAEHQVADFVSVSGHFPTFSIAHVLLRKGLQSIEARISSELLLFLAWTCKGKLTAVSVHLCGLQHFEFWLFKRTMQKKINSYRESRVTTLCYLTRCTAVPTKGIIIY